MLKNKKILIILLSFIILIFALNVNSFASVELTAEEIVIFKDRLNYVFDNYEENIGEVTNYIVSYNREENWMFFYFGDDLIWDGNYSCVWEKAYFYQYVGDELSIYDFREGNTNIAIGGSGEIIYSNFDVVNKGGNVVFSSLPIPSDFFPRPPQGTLAPIVEEMKMKATLQEIILILPLIIVVVVSLVGLRKALQILLTLLHRCLII